MSLNVKSQQNVSKDAHFIGRFKPIILGLRKRFDIQDESSRGGLWKVYADKVNKNCGIHLKAFLFVVKLMAIVSK